MAIRTCQDRIPCTKGGADAKKVVLASTSRSELISHSIDTSTSATATDRKIRPPVIIAAPTGEITKNNTNANGSDSNLSGKDRCGANRCNGTITMRLIASARASQMPSRQVLSYDDPGFGGSFKLEVELEPFANSNYSRRSLNTKR